jgi:hypothetical protein
MQSGSNPNRCFSHPSNSSKRRQSSNAKGKQEDESAEGKQEDEQSYFKLGFGMAV